jgi:Flp pilus assembly protein TadG
MCWIADDGSTVASVQSVTANLDASASASASASALESASTSTAASASASAPESAHASEPASAFASDEENTPTRGTWVACSDWAFVLRLASRDDEV